MSRYDVYANPSGHGYLLDVQADILQPLNTRAVVPLAPLSEAPKPAKTLNPVFDIHDELHAMVTQYIAAVPVSELQTRCAVSNSGTTILWVPLIFCFMDSDLSREGAMRTIDIAHAVSWLEELVSGFSGMSRI